MKSKILNYIDFERINTMLEGFNKATGFVTAILDTEGNILSRSGWRQICTEFHRINPESVKNCKLSDTILANESAKYEKYHFYKCFNGLIDVAFPIIIKGEHIANLFSGQLFFEEPDMDFFKNQARKYGFDENKYLSALKKVPVVSKDKVESTMIFLANLLQIITDITLEKMEQLELNDALKKSEDALAKSKFKLEMNMLDLLESQRIAQLGTWRLNIASNQVVWSEELYKMYGFDPTLPPPPYTEHMKLFTEESWNRLSIALERTRTTGMPYELELEMVSNNGNKGWMWVRGEAIKDSEGNITFLWGAAQDITKWKEVEGKLFQLAYHDHLTGLYNRRYFEQILTSLDMEENLPLSVIMCDFNGLKLINDSFGHEFGDKLLIKAADIIRKVSREGDIVARIGGDEFSILLPSTDIKETVQIAQKIKELAEKEKVSNIEISISYGYDTKENNLKKINDIVANAENHMYRHKLYERTSMRSKVIDIIMNTLFEKSNREMQHSARVSKICEAIASKMNFESSYVDKVRVCGLIHDIGKIGIDEKILNKPEQLTSDERKVIEGHTEAGWRILSSTSEFTKLALFVRDHHEKWDGSGYPNGLAGEAIPLEARIIAVADAYDAMTSERTYKNACSKEEAIEELRRCSGTHFDKRIVDVFINEVLAAND